uniref:Sulfotransferase n=1 Tax=Bubo bubo TaxID=30461 RepID=A0A8C0FAU8_BUBBB
MSGFPWLSEQRAVAELCPQGLWRQHYIIQNSPNVIVTFKWFSRILSGTCTEKVMVRVMESFNISETSLPIVLQIIYVTRNPKDVMVSYYHFSKYISTLEEIPDFNLFMERFLAGKVLASSWLDHVAGWYSHAEDFNILFVTYEEMKKVRSAVLKICNFLGKKLSEEEVDSVVRQATFENMRKDPRANYENLPDDIVEKNKGSFLRKGIVGDWKNIMTVAQNERFDKVLTEKMKTLQSGEDRSVLLKAF